MVALLVPVLGRAHQIKPLLESIQGATLSEHQVVLIFSPDDTDTIKEAKRAKRGLKNVRLLIATWNPDHADYAKKLKLGFRNTNDEWLFQGATDLVFHSGWDTAALTVAQRTGCQVIGTNDLGNPLVKRGRHSTHTLFSRSYIEEYGGTADDSGLIFSEAYDHQWCNPPEAPIWMGDLSFRPLGEVVPGDEVVGWSRSGPPPGEEAVIEEILAAEGSNRDIAGRVGVSATHVQAVRSGNRVYDSTRRVHEPLRRLCVATVLSVRERRSPLVRVFTESGRSFTCTPDHQWLNAKWFPSSTRGSEWTTPDLGATLLHVMDEPAALAAEDERLAGWLGGIYDGEGTGVYAAMQSQVANPDVVAAIENALTSLEIAHTREVRPNREGSFSKGSVVSFVLNDGRRGYLNFLLKTQPVKRTKLVEKILNGSRFGMRDKIVAVESAGEGPVKCMMTTSGNYVVWGFASKNSDTEFIETARLRRQFAFSKRSTVEHLHPHWGKAQMDDTYEKAFRCTSEDMKLYQSRRAAVIRLEQLRRRRYG